MTVQRCSAAIEDPRLPVWVAELADDRERPRLAGTAGTDAAGSPLPGVQVTAVRYQDIVHDFVMVNALRSTNAADAAINQACTFLRNALTDAPDHDRGRVDEADAG